MLKQHREHITFVKRASTEMVKVRAVLERTKAENKARHATCTLGLPHTHEPSEQELRETKAKLEQQLLERDQAIQRMSSEQELRDAKTEQVQQALVRKAGEACTLASVATHTHEPPSLAPPPGAGAARCQGQAGARRSPAPDRGRTAAV